MALTLRDTIDTVLFVLFCSVIIWLMVAVWRFEKTYAVYPYPCYWDIVHRKTGETNRIELDCPPRPSSTR